MNFQFLIANAFLFDIQKTNFIDVLLALFLIYGIVRGFLRGLFVELGALIGIGLGIFIASAYYREVANYAVCQTHIIGWWLLPLVFILIMSSIFGIIFLIAKLLEKVFDLVAMGWLNKTAGALFGLLKQAFVLSVMIQLLIQTGMIQPKTSANIQSSVLFSPIEKVAPMLFPSLKNLKFPEIKGKIVMNS